MNRTMTMIISSAASLGVLAGHAWDRARRSEAECGCGASSRARCDRDGALVRSPAVVKIQHDTFAILRAYVEAAPGELTLLGTAQHDRVRNEIVVDRLLLPAQFSSAGRTEVSEQELAELLVEAVAEGVDTTHLRVWVHSHGPMQAFFSTVDDECIQNAFPQADWVLSLVTNHTGQTKARLSLYSPLRLDLDDLPVKVGLPQELEEAICKEFEEKVRQRNGHAARHNGASGWHEAHGSSGDGQYEAQPGDALRGHGAGAGRSSRLQLFGD